MNSNNSLNTISKDIKPIKVGDKVINDVGLNEEVRQGKSVMHIISEFQKAAKKNLISYPDNVSHI